MEANNIFIFVGQFGNKIGYKLITILNLHTTYCDSEDTDKDVFIAVDTESKVVRYLQTKAGKNFAGQGVFDKKGRGGNWSMGYHLQCEAEYGIPIKETIVKMVRRRTRNFSTKSCRIIIVHSLVGGTGGGLGCAILESLRDEFPAISITSVTVAPFVSGESPLQHYNALLTLHWLQRYADCVLLFHNDEVMNHSVSISGVPKVTQKGSLATLSDINDYICYNVASLFYKLPYDYQQLLSKAETKKTENKCFVGQTSTRSGSQRLETGVTTGDLQKITSKANRLSAKMTTMSIHKHTKRSNKTDYECMKNDSNPIRSTDRKMSHLSKNSCTSITSGNQDISANSGTSGMKIHRTDDDKQECTATIKDNILHLLTPNSKKKFIASLQKHSRRITSDFKPVLSSLIKNIVKKDQNGQNYINSSVVLIARGECSKALDFEKDKVLNYLKQNLVLEDQQNPYVDTIASE
eukprot:gene13533-4418_t